MIDEKIELSESSVTIANPDLPTITIVQPASEAVVEEAVVEESNVEENN